MSPSTAISMGCSEGTSVVMVLMSAAAAGSARWRDAHAETARTRAA